MIHSCYICGKPATDRHHIFGGANRPKSEHPGQSFADRYGYNYLDDDDRKSIQPGTDIIPLDELIKELEVK